MKILFFTGKGGVGKSTNSALRAVHLASGGHRVLLNSIDPAHNLHDIFKMPLSEKPKEIAPGLQVIETDLNVWVKKYLKDMEQEFKNVYRYMEAFNLHKYFKILKYSPGIEEYAVLLAMENTLQRYQDKDYIIFDTPPTALTLKFLALPKVSLLWLKELASFREQILKKKDIVAKIHRKNAEVCADPVLERIEHLIQRYERISDLLTDEKKTSVHIVLNNDSLSLAESEDIFREVTNLGIKVTTVILNKFNGSGDSPKDLEKHFKGTELLTLPAGEGECTGLETLTSFPLPAPPV
ncbi:MAG: ArsA family ATPase [Spirochaetales bacterium]|nr:ArsA family ATPase [Spirochaetales bacterium]